MKLENKLQMLTSEEVGALTNVSDNQVNMWRECGLLKGIRTGKNWMYSQDELTRFQTTYNGYDISNKKKIRETIVLLEKLGATNE